MDPIGRANENQDLLLNGEDIRKILDFIKANKKNKKMDIQYGCPGFLGMEYEKEVRPQFFYCRTGISIASILYNGDLFVCPNVPRLPKFIQGNIKEIISEMFGKINTKSLEIKNEPNVMSVKSVKSGNIAKVALSIHGTLRIIAKVNAHIR